MNRWTKWLKFPSTGSRGGIAVIAAIVFVVGIVWHHVGLLLGGAVALCFVLRRVSNDDSDGGDSHESMRPRRTSERSSGSYSRATGTNNATESDTDSDKSVAEAPRKANRSAYNGHPKNTDTLVDDMLTTGRYALLLRSEAKKHLSQVHVVRAIRQLDEEMALVPAGRVLLGQLAEQSNSACGSADVDPKLLERNLVSVEPAYLDRFCITNEQFQQFVDSGGYEQLEFWKEEALPALLDFVDQTGAPGPRYWYDGQFPNGGQRLPVVGISWYEAAAFSRWAGKRLPTDAEWTKAGAWPVESSPGRIAQRRYPWGESFDVRRAHLYGAGQPGPVAVDEYPGGTSVGGVHQLIGNVWEWTSTPLIEMGDHTLHVSESVMSIRGGAFDTYFENQATCHYQSGEHPLSRRPNIGFRLALPMAELEATNDVTEDAPVSRVVDEPAAAAPIATGALAAC